MGGGRELNEKPQQQKQDDDGKDHQYPLENNVTEIS